MITGSTAKTYRKLRNAGKLTPRMEQSLTEYERRYPPKGIPAPVVVHLPSPTVDESTPPKLESFAAEMVTADLAGGNCRACGAEVKDTALSCGRCGARVRLDKCAHCGAALEGGAAFCSQCSKPVEVPKAVAPPAPGAGTTTAMVPVAPPPAPLWTVGKVLWIGGLINAILKRKGLEPLDEDEKKELHEAFVPVLNKWLLPMGPWADEIRLAIVAGTMIGARLYVLWVILPEREEKRKLAAEEKEKLKKSTEIKL